MKRYSTTKLKRDKSGIISYQTTRYPSIPIQDSDRFIVTRVGDRIDSLAYKFYGDSTLWWIIAKANGFNGKVAFDNATNLRIPGNVSEIIENFQKLNKSQ